MPTPDRGAGSVRTQESAREWRTQPRLGQGGHRANRRSVRRQRSGGCLTSSTSLLHPSSNHRTSESITSLRMRRAVLCIDLVVWRAADLYLRNARERVLRDSTPRSGLVWRTAAARRSQCTVTKSTPGWVDRGACRSGKQHRLPEAFGGQLPSGQSPPEADPVVRVSNIEADLPRRGAPRVVPETRCAGSARAASGGYADGHQDPETRFAKVGFLMAEATIRPAAVARSGVRAPVS